MMLPALLMLETKRKRRFVLPIPLVPFWPLLLLAPPVLLVVGLLRRRGFNSAPVWLFACMFHLRGLHIRVRSRDGRAVRLDFT